jgi:hypothetical protein
MSDSLPLYTPAPKASVADMLRRAAGPFFLFSSSLMGLLLLSWMFLLPSLTRVEVGGEARGETTNLLNHLTGASCVFA